MALLVGACLQPAPGCHEPSATRPVEPPAADAPEAAATVADPPQERAPLIWPANLDDPDRWLYVEGVRDGEKGAWATGTFHRGKNKLDIHTHRARKFAVDTSRIPIDWRHLVVLGIDGVNSELGRRDFTLYHFALDDHGCWVVLEP